MSTSPSRILRKESSDEESDSVSLVASKISKRSADGKMAKLGLSERDERAADEVRSDFKHQMRNISIEDAMQWRREAIANKEWGPKRDLHWSEKIKASVYDKAPPALVPLPRSAGRCSWRGEDENGWRYICNSNVVRNEVTGAILQYCAYHVPSCIMPHPVKGSETIEIFNQFSLCNYHYVATYDVPPDPWDSPFVVPGVVRKIRKRERDDGAQSHFLSPSEPPPPAPERIPPPLPPNTIWGHIKLFYWKNTTKRRIRRGGNRAAARIQATFRRNIARRHFKYMKLERSAIKREKAITIMQRTVRARQHRRRFRLIKTMKISAALNIQRVWRGMKSRRIVRRERAARVIQRNWRGLTSRMFIRAVKKQRRALIIQLDREWGASTIQRYWRGILGRRIARKRRDLFWKRHVAARTIQRTMKRWLEKILAKRARDQMLRRHKAAIVIQCAWRRYRAMKLLKWMRWAYTKAARLIQRVWRGYKGRVQARKLREGIEAAWQWLHPPVPRDSFGHFLAKTKAPYGASEPLMLRERKPWEFNKVFHDSVSDLVLGASGDLSSVLRKNEILVPATSSSSSSSAVPKQLQQSSIISSSTPISKSSGGGSGATISITENSIVTETDLEKAGLVNSSMWPRDMFAKWDPSDTGLVSRVDFKLALECKKEFITPESMLRILHRFDLKGNGCVSYPLFLQFARRQSYPCSIHRAWACVQCVCYTACSKCKCHKFKKSEGTAVCGKCNHYMTAHQLRPKPRIDKPYRQGETLSRKQMRVAMAPPTEESRPTTVDGIDFVARTGDTKLTPVELGKLGKPISEDPGIAHVLNEMRPRAVTALATLAKRLHGTPADLIKMGDINIIQQRRGMTAPLLASRNHQVEIDGVGPGGLLTEPIITSPTQTITNAVDSFDESVGRRPMTREEFRSSLSNARDDEKMLVTEITNHKALNPATMEKGFDILQPIPLIVDGELKMTNNASLLYLDVLLLLADTEVDVVGSTERFYELAFNTYVFLQRHWRKLCSDIRTGTLDENLKIDGSLRALIESQLTPQPERSALMTARFKELGFFDITARAIESRLASRRPSTRVVSRPPSNREVSRGKVKPASSGTTGDGLSDDRLRPRTSSAVGQVRMRKKNNSSIDSPIRSRPVTSGHTSTSHGDPATAKLLNEVATALSMNDFPATSSRECKSRGFDTTDIPKREILTDRPELLRGDYSRDGHSDISEPLTPKAREDRARTPAEIFAMSYKLSSAPRDGKDSGMVRVKSRHSAPFLCAHPACGKFYTTPAALEEHQLTVHDGRARLVTSTPEIDQRMVPFWPKDHPWNSKFQTFTRDRLGCRYACPLCDKRFLRQGFMESHMKVFHRTSYARWLSQDPNITWLGESWCVPPKKSPDRARIPVCPQHWGGSVDERCRACKIAHDGMYPALPTHFYPGADMKLSTERLNKFGILEQSVLHMRVGDPLYAVTVIDPFTGGIRQARVVALCNDTNNRNWAAVSYFWDLNSVTALGYIPKRKDIDVDAELFEDTVVQYIDLTCMFDECLVLEVASKEHFTKRIETEYRIVDHLKLKGRVYYSRERFSSATLETMSSTLLSPMC